ncbi:MAG: THUMP domain-containing protein [Nanoarchaeota archaeon]|nr:THUMP domain-containing protein [Nanoarchaeota archaeon]
MEYIAATIEGIEEIAILEVKELLNVKAKTILPGRIVFETKNIEPLIEMMRSIDRIYESKSKFEFFLKKDILNSLPEIEIEETFKAQCSRKGTHLFSSKEIEKEVGEFYYKKGNPVDLHKPKTIIYIDIIGNFCFIGKLITKKRLHKRDYRLKLVNQSPNPLLAYALVRFSGWDKGKILLDPFCKDGVIPIEAALFGLKLPRDFSIADNKKSKLAKLRIFGYDPLMPNIKNCEINSKLAGVRKAITFSRIGTDWLDVKFKKGSVDSIAAVLPFISKGRDCKDIEKEYLQFFNQAEFILKKKGTIALLAHRHDLVGKYDKKFKKIKTLEIKIGGMEYKLILYAK